MAHPLPRSAAQAFALLAVLFLVLDARADSFQRDELLVESGGRAHRFEVELALTPDQRAQGLMFRTSLGEDAGMLFLFPEPRVVHMWMKNTMIPLDMVFLDDSGRILRITADVEPLSTSLVSSERPARAVLELNAGVAERLGIRAGDRVVHPLFSERLDKGGQGSSGRQEPR